MNKKQYICGKIKSYYKKKHQDKNVNINLIRKAIDENYQGGFFKVYASIKKRIYKVFKKNNKKFNASYTEIIGCEVNELEKFIVNKFSEGMSIENYGEWQIDHIIPVSSFDFSIESNIIRCFNYNNLQPLWKKDNMEKSNRIDYVVTKI
jgi:hypothetical protein